MRAPAGARCASDGAGRRPHVEAGLFYRNALRRALSNPCVATPPFSPFTLRLPDSQPCCPGSVWLSPTDRSRCTFRSVDCHPSPRLPTVKAGSGRSHCPSLRPRHRTGKKSPVPPSSYRRKRTDGPVDRKHRANPFQETVRQAMNTRSRPRSRVSSVSCVIRLVCHASRVPCVSCASRHAPIDTGRGTNDLPFPNDPRQTFRIWLRSRSSAAA